MLNTPQIYAGMIFFATSILFAYALNTLTPTAVAQTALNVSDLKGS